VIRDRSAPQQKSHRIGAELPKKKALDEMLQRWPVSKRVNSSRAPDDDPTLIDRISI
jgi:hypothetical protein